MPGRVSAIRPKPSASSLWGQFALMPLFYTVGSHVGRRQQLEEYDIIDVMSRGELVYELLRHVRPLVLNSARVVERRLTEHHWTVGMRAVMEVLDGHGPLPVPALARDLDLARQNVQRHVDDLRRLGHVEQRPNPGHRRSVLIAATTAGAAVFAAVRSAELDALGAIAPECTAEDLAGAARVLAAVDRDVRSSALDRQEDR